MPRLNVSITRQLRDEDYRRVLEAAHAVCGYGLLVVQDGVGLEPAGTRVLTGLKGSLVRRERSSSWPGTQLSDSTAELLVFEYNPKSIAILSSAARGLYEWQQPALPEDLCLLREDESPWLVTIAHENDSYLVLSEDELADLATAVPEFATAFSPDH